VAAPSRRDFLKLGSLLSGALAASRFLPQDVRHPGSGAGTPNIIIFVFDAMSAKNLSLYGYPRKTTPNFERFAARATVYHQHYAPGNFTTPGTASLFTGLYPWTHRAINESGLIAPERVHQNVFKLMGDRYYRLAYSQNVWANYLFGQFEGDIEKVLSPGSFTLADQFVSAGFTGDLANSHRAFDDLLFHDKAAPASLVFGLAQNIQLYEAVVRAQKSGDAADISRAADYPLFFRLRDVFNGMLQTLGGLKTPFLAYLHAWAPHGPYRPAHEFTDLFKDGWHPVAKPDHVLSEHETPASASFRRRSYDRYIANVDFEFGHLLDGLQAKGILDTSYVIVTSDHGEMFERGLVGHVTPLLYDPVVHVPLIISSPGQKSRGDVHIPTSNIDLLPTLAHLSGNEVPDWAEGQILPGLGGPEEPERSLFTCEAKYNHPWEAWSQASYALRKGDHKLTYYTGYQPLAGEERFELYDMLNDPDELNNKYLASSSIAQDLRRELLGRVQAENARHKKAG
jgi:arylsulfatase A-like enzyme